MLQASKKSLLAEMYGKSGQKNEMISGSVSFYRQTVDQCGLLRVVSRRLTSCQLAKRTEFEFLSLICSAAASLAR